jgi:alkanesulfonate monooxygenase SsuD/methylene tetrahydromethanopterin reductase-like flavin-dependent oxidoreductase (luciferase family)
MCTTPGRVDYDGSMVELRGLPFEPKPVQASGIPVLVGGSGRRLRSIAARRADIYNGFWPPSQWAEVNADLDERMHVAGRTPEALQRSVFVQTELSTAPDRQDRFVAEVMATRGGSDADVRGRCLVGSVGAMVDVLGSYQAAGVEMAVLSIGPATPPDELERFAGDVVAQVAR